MNWDSKELQKIIHSGVDGSINNKVNGSFKGK